MQIVINLDEDVYTRLFDNGVPTSLADGIVIERAIRTGTVLSKHGDLVDRSEIEVEEDVYNQTYIIHAPTILEANK